MSKIIGSTLGILIVLSLMPFATIASLNTLFGLGIEYTLGSWASAFWIQVLPAWLVRSGVDAAIKGYYQPK